MFTYSHSGRLIFVVKRVSLCDTKTQRILWVVGSFNLQSTKGLVGTFSL